MDEMDQTLGGWWEKGQLRRWRVRRAKGRGGQCLACAVMLAPVPRLEYLAWGNVPCGTRDPRLAIGPCY